MINFEMFVATKETESVKLTYREDASQLISSWRFYALNNPDKYKFLLNGDWVDFDVKQDSNWSRNFSIVEKNNKPVGYISWDVDRTSKVVSESGLFIDGDNWGYDVPMVALKKWADLVLLERNYHKLIVTGHKENKHLFAILQEAKKIGLREVGTYKDHALLIDNCYYDVTKFELTREDYINNLDRINKEYN